MADKQCTTTYGILAKCITEVISNPATPVFLTQGKTYIIPKSKYAEHPYNYTPFTCLPILYKIKTLFESSKIEQQICNTN